MRCQNKTNGFDAIKYPTALMDNSIHDFTTLAYLCRGMRIGNDSQVFQFVRTLDVGVRTHVDIFNDACIFNNGTIPDLAIIAAVCRKFLLGQVKISLLQ